MTVRPRHVQPLHIGLALLIVALWGTNFVVIKWGLRELPPFLFVCLRFTACAFPFVLFIRRPPVAWHWLALYGLLIGAAQFGLLFYAMRADISPGMASLVIQIQVFFTIAMAMWIFHERTTPITWVGTLLAAAGLAVIGFNLDATITGFGVVLVVMAAAALAGGNIVIKRVARESNAPVNMLGFMVWSSIFAIPPLLLMTLAFEGWQAGLDAIANASFGAWAALAWQVVGNTLFGYAAWSWLLMRYDAAVVAPYALLIPIFGMGSSALLLGEALPGWKLAAASMVLGGITLITLWGRRR